MQLAPIEWLGLEGDGCTIACLGAVHVDLSAQLHPGHGEDRASIGRRQSEGVFFAMFQQVQITCEIHNTHNSCQNTAKITFN